MEEPSATTEFAAEVRYGALRHREWFRSRLPDLQAGDRCVVRTDRGVEVGRMVTDSRPVEEVDGDPESREILRLLSPDDASRERELAGERRREAAEYCCDRIAARELPMKLVQVEHLLGGNRIVFYFTAPRRVDFRDLVRDLSRRFRTRIELRQIGARDEARVLGDDEMCGRELCCRAYMRELKPVTMKMAKNQKTTLDPSRISGRCGRLMCCLRYEDEAYTSLKMSLPRCGAEVECPGGHGKVVAQDVLRQCVEVRLSGGRRVVCPVAEVGEPEAGPADEDGPETASET
jgi:cell fate regulator YaaT (PSP1 superfamily)